MSAPESTSTTAAAHAASSSLPEQSTLGRKIVLSALLGALVFLGLALYSDLPKLRAAALDFAPPAFVWGLSLVAINYAIRIIRWQFFLKQLGIALPWLESSLLFLSGFVMSVTPGKVGEVFKSLLLLESRRVSFARTAPIVIAERLTDLMALVFLTALGCLAFPSGTPIALGGGLAVALMVLVASHRGIGEWLLALCDRLPLVQRLSSRLREAHEALLALTRASIMVPATALSLVGWAMECGTMYIIVHGFRGVTMGLEAATFAYSASTIVGALAMMPGGLGVTEVGMTGLVQSMGGEGMTAAVAAATTILVRVATLWFAVLLGFASLALHRMHSARHTLAPLGTGNSAPPSGPEV